MLLASVLSPLNLSERVSGDVRAAVERGVPDVCSDHTDDLRVSKERQGSKCFIEQGDLEGP